MHRPSFTFKRGAGVATLFSQQKTIEYSHLNPSQSVLSEVAVKTVGIQVYAIQFKPGLHNSRKDRKHMFGNMFFRMPRYGLLSISF